jgi:beta-phosphoglucomutase-like phosphatase (HAD superfamily)
MMDHHQDQRARPQAQDEHERHEVGEEEVDSPALVADGQANNPTSRPPINNCTGRLRHLDKSNGFGIGVCSVSKNRFDS